MPTKQVKTDEELAEEEEHRQWKKREAKVLNQDERRAERMERQRRIREGEVVVPDPPKEGEEPSPERRRYERHQRRQEQINSYKGKRPKL